MAIEDAYVLSRLLAMPECTRDNAEAFLQVYEEVRRPRGLRQQMHACETGEVSPRVVGVEALADWIVQMFEYATEKWGSDTAAIAEEMLHRTDWIWDYNIENDIKDAEALLKERKLL